MRSETIGTVMVEPRRLRHRAVQVQVLPDTLLKSFCAQQDKVMGALL